LIIKPFSFCSETKKSSLDPQFLLLICSAHDIRTKYYRHPFRPFLFLGQQPSLSTIPFHPSTRINPSPGVANSSTRRFNARHSHLPLRHNFIALNPSTHTPIHPILSASFQPMSSNDFSAPPLLGACFALAWDTCHALIAVDFYSRLEMIKKGEPTKVFPGDRCKGDLLSIPSRPRLHVFAYSIYQPVCSICHLFPRFLYQICSHASLAFVNKLYLLTEHLLFPIIPLPWRTTT